MLPSAQVLREPVQDALLVAFVTDRAARGVVGGRDADEPDGNLVLAQRVVERPRFGKRNHLVSQAGEAAWACVRSSRI
jgi:hypothetical protein